MTHSAQFTQLGQRSDDPPDVSTRSPCVPALATAVGALAALPVGIALPHRPSRRFRSTIANAGLPVASATVTLTAFRQVVRPVPTFAIVQGVHTPARITNSMTTFLVRHPHATFLIDPAICDDIAQRVLPQLPAPIRAFATPPSDVISVRESMEELGISPTEIAFALPTHLHWDHVSGLVDFPSMPITSNRLEWEWATGGRRAPRGVARRALEDRAVEHYELDGPPVLTFERSHDLFGDGSVVLVDMAGHTPGSVGIVLHLGEDRWALMAGDAVWHQLQVAHVRPTASFPGRLADADRRSAFRTIQRLAAAADARIAVVPTHDHDAAVPYVAAA
jgi:glyoxylase-like metal-dependent hydrolase (beta-lactamase superfamily II)